VWYSNSPWHRKIGNSTVWGMRTLGNLYTSVGAPTSAMRETWNDVSDAVKSAPKAERKAVMEAAWPAAVGLFLSDEADSAELREFATTMGEPWPAELRALQAIAQKDTSSARLILSTDNVEPAMTDSAYKARPMWWGYRAPLLAQAHFLLGDYQSTIKLLEQYQPDHFSTRGFDPRWGLLGRVRLLRAQAYEKLGRRQEASMEYKQVLEQWSAADPALQEYILEAQKGAARLRGTG